MGADQKTTNPWSPAVMEFLRRPLHAVLATHAPNGSISQSVVWYRLETDSIWISVRPSSAKARHVALDDRISLLALAPHGGAYVRVEGRGLVDGEVSNEDRLALVQPYQGADAQAWLVEHPLPTPNAKLWVLPDRVVESGVDLPR